MDIGVAGPTDAGIDRSHDATADQRVNRKILHGIVRNVFGRACLTERPISFEFGQYRCLASCLALLGVPADHAVHGRVIEAFQGGGHGPDRFPPRFVGAFGGLLCGNCRCLAFQVL